MLCVTQAMVYCGNKAAWEKVWAHAPRVQITDKESEFKKFVEHKKYDKVRPFHACAGASSAS